MMLNGSGCGGLDLRLVFFVSSACGKIVMPKTEIPNMGHFAVALDPEVNGFGIFEGQQ